MWPWGHRKRTPPAPTGAKMLGVSLRGADTHEGLGEATASLRPDSYPSFTGTNTGGRFSFLLPAAIPHGQGLNIHFECNGYVPLDVRISTAQPECPSWDFEMLPAEKAWPEIPTRDAACTVNFHFQGLRVWSNFYSTEYAIKYGAGSGLIPFFGAALADFAQVGDLDQILDQLVAVNDSHVMAFLPLGGEGYNEPGQPYGNNQLIRAVEWWDTDWASYLNMVDTIIKRSLKPIFTISGEGQDGYQWIKAHFAEYVRRLRIGRDRLAYGPVMVVFDGVWPADWTVEQMKEMIPWMRSILGDSGYLAFMFGQGPAGNAYTFVEGPGDWGQPWLQCLDIMMQTGNVEQTECHEESGCALGQLAKRMLGPAFTPTAEVPDPGGPFYMAPGTPRGPYFWGFAEWRTYETVRAWVTAEQVEVDRRRMRSVGIKCLG